MYCVLCILWCILWASGPEINVILSILSYYPEPYVHKNKHFSNKSYVLFLAMSYVSSSIFPVRLPGKCNVFTKESERT